MSENSWLAIVIGSAAVLAVVAVAFVLHTIKRPANGSRVPQSTSDTDAPLTGHRRRAGRRWGPTIRPPRRRSVEDNFARACERIDNVDPYVVQRRIGHALAEVGLISSPSVFDDPPLPKRGPSSREAPGLSQRWEDEA